MVFDARDGRFLGEPDVVPGDHPPVFVGHRWLLLVDTDGMIRIYDLPGLRFRGEVNCESAHDVPQTVHAPPGGNTFLVGTRRGVLLRFALDGL